jgi:hypothetical protein
LAQFKSVVTLVPDSGIQFVDFGLNIDPPFRVTCTFLEESQGDAADGRVTLQALISDEGELRHPITGQAVDGERAYSFNAAKSLEPFVGKWVPIPFLRCLGQDAEGREVLDEGPSNWARVFVPPTHSDEGQSATYRVVLGFDTGLDFRPRLEGRTYPAPTSEDAKLEAMFAFSADVADVGGFVSEAWVDEWLEKCLLELRQSRQRGRAPASSPANALEHAARYLTFLKVLEQGCRFPKVRLIDTVSKERSYSPIMVDLVLDVGNSRTCGILIESDPDDSDRLDLTKSYVLSLRDLSQPEHVYAQAFESRVEFSRAAFGHDGISRRSGRANAFHWPSLVRVGPEAVRLSVSGAGTEGATGLSSPKRYLWDRRPLNQLWRFRAGGNAAAPADSAVSGPIMAFMTEEGDVLRQLKRPAAAALRPKFCRSSLFTFLMTEIILQAMVLINSPESRGRQRNADVPRQLRRIIMTIPPATPLAERRIMKDRVEGAVKLSWQALGWTDAAKAANPEPQVVISLDEATCTQIVYLFTEITQKFRGTPGEFFELVGKVRPKQDARPSLRVASIDIGGGTTDLMVINYMLEGRRAIVPTQIFREGFKIAGDDILEAVVARHVLTAIEDKLTAAGVPDARSFLRGLVGADRGGQSEQDRQQRRRFVGQVGVPVALALLREYEMLRPFAEEATHVRTIGEVLATLGGSALDLCNEVDHLAAGAGAAGFSLQAVPVAFNADALAGTVRSVIGPALDDFAEVVHALDCDVLLLSGRPSRLPIVSDLLLARVAVRPDRVIAMHQYRVGRWYPFRDAYDRIDDPKTTVAVGALLCSVAESQIEGFAIRTNRLNIRSTARYIGEMELSGQIRAENVFFSDIDLESRTKRDQTSRSVGFDGPMTIGFRQLAIERWPATPLYVMEFANPGNVGRMRLPLSVTLERADAEEGDEARKEDFRISDIQDADGTALRPSDVTLRLQTLKSANGYWLDTGVVGLF